MEGKIRNFDYIGRAKELVSMKSQNETTKSYSLYLQHQLLKVIFYQIKIELRNKVEFYS